MTLSLLAPESQACAVIDPFLLSALRCPDCLSPLVAAGAALVCGFCRRDYPIRHGIPSLFAATENTREHQQTWDYFISDNYEKVVEATSAILAEVDRVALSHCRGDLLDIGCGSGRFLSHAMRAPRVGRSVGLDVSAGMLAAAAARGCQRLVHGSANHLPFADGAFDAAASTFGSLQYVERGQAYREIARVLRDGGFLVFDLLNFWPEYFDHAWERLRTTGRWPRGLAREYLLRHKMRSARQEVSLLEEAGFSLRALKSIPYLPLLRRRIKKLGSWNGYLASRLGADTIFVAVKSPSPVERVRHTVWFSDPYSAPLKA
jgi:ubiquinone/menaquinone biosynthesis C-methylase UbiE